jgi:hypothetical protein
VTDAPSKLDRLWELSRRLTEAGISHETVVYRDDAVSIVANVEGEYWEIDFLDDGTVDVEIYVSRGLEEEPLAAIERLIADNRETDDESNPTKAN